MQGILGSIFVSMSNQIFIFMWKFNYHIFFNEKGYAVFGKAYIFFKMTVAFPQFEQSAAPSNGTYYWTLQKGLWENKCFLSKKIPLDK